MRNVLFAVALLSALCEAGPEGNLLLSLGEAPHRPASDIGDSKALAQAGIGFAWRGKYLTPYHDLTLARYNGATFWETVLGIHIGYPIGWLKPGLIFEAGIQSAADKEFRFEDDHSELKRRTRYPWGLGLRADFFDRFYGAWEQRGAGYPWWRLSIGYRVL